VIALSCGITHSWCTLMLVRWLPLLITCSLAAGCAQRDEIIAVAPDDDSGTGGAGGEGGEGGGPPLIAVMLETPSCASTFDTIATGPVDAQDGEELIVGGDSCIALYRSEGMSFAAPQVLVTEPGSAVALGRLRTTSPAASDEPLDLVRGGAAAQVMLGDGDGAFASGQSIVLAAPVLPGGLWLENALGDGALDLLSAEGAELVVRMGEGNGSFGVPHPFAVPGGAHALTVAQYDDDGSLDAVVAGASASLLLGDGMGGYHGAQAIEGGDHVGAVASGDFDGDGCADVAGVEGQALLAGAVDAALLLWLGDCAGHLTLSDSTVVSQPTGVAFGDVGKDGVLDLVVTRQGGVTQWALDLSGMLAVAREVALDGTPTRARVVPSSGDVVVAASDRVFVIAAP
jgi:FG-GAP-like repeat